MEMRFFWVTDQVNQGYFDIRWHPGQENMVDYPSKHHFTVHHRLVRPYDVHTTNFLRYWPRAFAPSAMRGCAGTLDNGYVRTVPLPRVTRWNKYVMRAHTRIKMRGNAHNKNIIYVARMRAWQCTTRKSAHSSIYVTWTRKDPKRTSLVTEGWKQPN